MTATPLASTTVAAWTTVATPNGPFTAICDDDGTVIASGWTDDPTYLVDLIHETLRPTSIQQSTTLDAVRDAVESYYAGNLTAIDAVPVRQQSGPFIQQAWATLRTVPAGEPVSYTRFAELSGRPLATRAAASACARNAAALFVPCHRVLRNDGKLGGFRYGLPVKRWLLDFENPPIGTLS